MIREPPSTARRRAPLWAVASLVALGVAVAVQGIYGVLSSNKVDDLEHRLSQVCGQLGSTTTTATACRTVPVIIQVPPVTVIVQNPSAPTTPNTSPATPSSSSTVKTPTTAAAPASSPATTAPPAPATSSAPSSSTSTSSSSTSTTWSTLPPLITIPRLRDASSSSSGSALDGLALDGLALDGAALVVAGDLLIRARRRENRRRSP